MAMTADGKIASSNRQLFQFGSTDDIEHLYQLRAKADAIITGATTLREAKVQLDNGGPKFEALRKRNRRPRHPLRIVTTQSGNLPWECAFFHSALPAPFVLTTKIGAKRLRRPSGIELNLAIFGRQEIDLTSFLESLKQEHGVNQLQCEGGGQLNDLFFRNGCVDELYLTISPHLCGGQASPTIVDGIGFPNLEQAAHLELISSRKKGSDRLLHLRVLPT